MKAIVLAGGSGHRLHPITSVANKHLLPVYDKPMIYYPIATLLDAGINEILIVSSPGQLPLFRSLLGDGKRIGVEFCYCEQEKPSGIAHALLLAESFIDGQRVSLILGDNIFYAPGLREQLRKAHAEQTDAVLFSHPVDDASQFGVVRFDVLGLPVEIVEKPKDPPSNIAITGLYVYPGDVVSVARGLSPSSRGELEITTLNSQLLAQGRLTIQPLHDESFWIDAGTPESLLAASTAVADLQRRLGRHIAAIEEVAWLSGFIEREDLYSLAREMEGQSAYRQYLAGLLQRERTARQQWIAAQERGARSAPIHRPYPFTT